MTHNCGTPPAPHGSTASETFTATTNAKHLKFGIDAILSPDFRTKQGDSKWCLYCCSPPPPTLFRPESPNCTSAPITPALSLVVPVAIPPTRTSCDATRLQSSESISSRHIPPIYSLSSTLNAVSSHPYSIPPLLPSTYATYLSSQLRLHASTYGSTASATPDHHNTIIGYKQEKLSTLDAHPKNKQQHDASSSCSISENRTSTTAIKRKRSWSRAVFSNLQRKGLEKRFIKQKYITKPDRRQLAASLGLTDAQVKVWFQNRRMKWRHAQKSKGVEELVDKGMSSSNSDLETNDEIKVDS